MRQQHRVRRIEKRLWHMRFVGENIEARSSNRTVLQGLRKRLLIHDRASPDIDEHAFRPKCLQHFRIDRPGGFRPAGGNENERIHRSGKFLEARIIIISHIGGLAAIVIGDRQAEGFDTAGDSLADAAKPENTDLAPAQRQLRQRIAHLFSPLAATQKFLRL